MRRVLVMIAVLAWTLTGCGSPAKAEPVSIPVTLAAGGANPSGGRCEAKLGATVTVTVTSDRDDEIHVHGYDVSLPVKAGQTATATFTADKTGRYEVEAHHPALLICTLDVR